MKKFTKSINANFETLEITVSLECSAHHSETRWAMYAKISSCKELGSVELRSQLGFYSAYDYAALLANVVKLEIDFIAKNAQMARDVELSCAMFLATGFSEVNE